MEIGILRNFFLGTASQNTERFSSKLESSDELSLYIAFTSFFDFLLVK